MICLVKTTSEGGELKNLGASGGSHSGGRGSSKCLKGCIRIHAKAVVEVDKDLKGNNGDHQKCKMR